MAIVQSRFSRWWNRGAIALVLLLLVVMMIIRGRRQQTGVRLRR